MLWLVGSMNDGANSGKLGLLHDHHSDMICPQGFWVISVPKGPAFSFLNYFGIPSVES